MTAPHFFIEGPNSLLHVEGQTLQPGSRVLLEEEDTHHASRVLRLRDDENITISDSLGTVAGAHVTGFPEQRVEAVVDTVRSVPKPRPLVIVVLAPPKGERLAWAVQKATEVGADAVTLMPCERGVREWPTADRAKRIHVRLNRIAREASMQSRRPFLTQVGWYEDLTEVFDVFDRSEGDRVLMLHESADVRLGEASWDLIPRRVVLLVGPEGGFSPSEVGAAEADGIPVVSLGPTILRTETAAVVGAALVLARYGRLG